MSKIEPYGYAFQHEETGLEQVVDVQQVEWGFEKNNPRWQKIGPVYPESALTALTEERDRIERNRDMWKGQVERQAADLESHAKALADIRRVGDSAYWKALSKFSDTPCLGWEAKVRAGTFGEAEHKAHAEANRLIGFHQGLYEALRIIREASTLPAPSSTTGEAA